MGDVWREDLTVQFVGVKVFFPSLGINKKGIWKKERCHLDSSIYTLFDRRNIWTRFVFWMWQRCTVNFWCFLWRLFKMNFWAQRMNFMNLPNGRGWNLWMFFHLFFWVKIAWTLFWGPQKNNCGTVGVVIFVGGPHNDFWRTSKSLNHSNSVSLLSNPPTSLP